MITELFYDCCSFLCLRLITGELLFRTESKLGSQRALYIIYLSMFNIIFKRNLDPAPTWNTHTYTYIILSPCVLLCKARHKKNLPEREIIVLPALFSTLPFITYALKFIFVLIIDIPLKFKKNYFTYIVNS